jgi:predicted neutral ceramidase superfamily lipid hydrolase
MKIVEQTHNTLVLKRGDFVSPMVSSLLMVIGLTLGLLIIKQNLNENNSQLINATSIMLAFHFYFFLLVVLKYILLNLLPLESIKLPT